MNKDQKLVDDIATLLRAAGYVGVKVQRDDAGTTLSCTRDGGGAMLRLATRFAKGPARSEVSAPEQQAERKYREALAFYLTFVWAALTPAQREQIAPFATPIINAIQAAPREDA